MAGYQRHSKYPGIEVYTRKNGTKRYRVRAQGADGRRISQTFERLGDARAWLAERDRLRVVERTGIDTERGTETLLAHIDDWRETWAAHNLQDATRESYDRVLATHIEPRIGHLQLRHVTPRVAYEVLARMQAETVGGPTIEKAFTALSSVLRRAVELGRIDLNPVSQVRVPSSERSGVVRAMEIDDVEAIRASLNGRWLIYTSLMAYAGLRPDEARGLRWENVLLDRGAIDVVARGAGRERRESTKTGHARSVPMLGALRADLVAEPGRSGYVVGDPARGITAEQHRNFTGRQWRAAVKAAGVAPGGTYRLRHTHASARIAEQRWTQTEIARQLGHDVKTLDKHYAHLLREATGRGPYDLELAIRQARDRHGTHPAGHEPDELTPVRLRIDATDPYGTGMPGLRQILTDAGLADIDITEDPDEPTGAAA